MGIGNLELLANFHLQHAHQMMRLIALGVFGMTVTHLTDKEPAESQAINTPSHDCAPEGTATSEKHPNQVILEAGGVCYDVTIPISTFSQLPATGAEVRLRIHTHVREEAFSCSGS